MELAQLDESITR